MLDKLIEDKSLTRYETQRLTREGLVLDVVIWAASHSRFKTGLTENFVILRDITEEKRLEANNKTIMRISAVLPEYPELEDLMTYISREVKELLNTEGALVLLYDEIKEELFFTGGSYDDSDTQKRAKKFRFPVDSIMAGEIIKTGEYALVNDAEKLLKKYPERDEKLGYKTRSLLEVPIKNEDRIIGHLSHELKTPVAILTGSLQILKKKLESQSNINVSATLTRIERNLNRIVDIQDEVADIMDDKTYSSQKMLLKMFEACQDEIETLIHQNIDANNFEHSIRQMIDEKFGPRSIDYKLINFPDYLNGLYSSLLPEFAFRSIDIQIAAKDDLPTLLLPEEILNKMIGGLIKNAIENTPDKGRIDICGENKDSGILLRIHDFGVGIEEDAQKRIFEGFFTTQETLLYSTKKPFAFNAGGKGADLLRMKIFSDRLGFILKMESKRCCFLLENNDYECPGDIEACGFCNSQKDCLNSGHSIFTVFFPSKKK